MGYRRSGKRWNYPGVQQLNVMRADFTRRADVATGACRLASEPTDGPLPEDRLSILYATVPGGAQAARARHPIAFTMVDIEAQLDSRAISPASQTGAGRFNVWGNSFPAEHLPEPGSTVEVDGVPFAFAPLGADGDNLRCAGQFVPVPAGRYDWIHLLAAAERRAEDHVAVHFADGSVDFEPLRISDFWSGAHPVFGDVLAFSTPVMHYPHHVQANVSALMWAQRVPVTRRTPMVGLGFPRNLAVHVFALTLQASSTEGGS